MKSRKKISILKAYRAADNVRNKRERMGKRRPLYGKSMMLVGAALSLIGLFGSFFDAFEGKS